MFGGRNVDAKSVKLGFKSWLKYIPAVSFCVKSLRLPGPPFCEMEMFATDPVELSEEWGRGICIYLLIQ